MNKSDQKEESADEPRNEITASKSVSFLPPDTLRWLNRRRPAGDNAVQVMTASRAMQLRNVFQSLDFDGGGEIELDELKEAINFVAKPRGSGPPLIDDPVKINKFFESMDVDGNGAVDFNEFLVGMTSGGGDDNQMEKMQQAFFEFANLNLRQTILEQVNDKGVSDLVKFQEMKKLFAIKFVKEEENIRSVEEQIKHAQQCAIKEMKELRGGPNGKQRSLEMNRARMATMHFTSETSNAKHEPLSIQAVVEKSKLRDVDNVRKRIEKQIHKHLAKYPLNSRTPTYEHDICVDKPVSQIKFGALLESQRIKGGLTAKQVVLPPISMKKQIVDAVMAKKPS